MKQRMKWIGIVYFLTTKINMTHASALKIWCTCGAPAVRAPAGAKLMLKQL